MKAKKSVNKNTSTKRTVKSRRVTSSPNGQKVEEVRTLEMQVIAPGGQRLLPAVITRPKSTSQEIQEERRYSLPYPPFDKEATEWMKDKNSIPGAYSPILYVGGTKILEGLASIFGRPMVLAEAKCLVIPDGPLATCAADKIQFQPVGYLPFVPNYLERLIREEGKTLPEIQLPYAGAYYVVTRPHLCVPAFSGTVFHYVKSAQAFKQYGGSPLMLAPSVLKEKFGINWRRGVTSTDAEKIYNSLVAVQDRRNRVAAALGERIAFGPARGHSNREGFANLGDIEWGKR